MADTSIKLLNVEGKRIPIKCVDNGDGTYALKTSAPTGAATASIMLLNADGARIPIELVALGDGTYALAVV